MTALLWPLGPSRGLLKAAADGYLIAFRAKRNAHNIPVRILIVQALIALLISLATFFMPDLGNAFRVFMALWAQIYTGMYLLMMFAFAFALRVKRPDLPRPFKIPGGRRGIGTVCAPDTAASFAALLAGFIPPAPVRRRKGWGAITLYSASPGLCTRLFLCLPPALMRWRAYRRARRNPTA